MGTKKNSLGNYSLNINDTKIGFIGFGNMASAICDGLLYKKVINPENIYACSRNRDKLQANCTKRGINAASSNEEVAKLSDIVVIGVLPQQVEAIVKELADSLKGKLIFSIAAGIGYDKYIDYLGEGYNHISTIPNTPIAVGEGIIIAESVHSLTEDQLNTFEGVFGQLAKIEYFEPHLIATGETGAGCATAFVDVFIEALADGLVKYGMTRKQAYSIVPQMMIGTAAYMMESGTHPGELKDAVCSPGGTTILGVNALEETGFRHSVIHAVDKIMERRR